MTTPDKTKTLRGKYRLAKNILVTCYVDVLEANDTELKTFVGLKERGDTSVPIGTTIFLDADTINRINVRRTNSLDVVSIKVLQVEELYGRPVHICTPIRRENRPDLRREERLETSFSVRMQGKDTDFTAIDGTVHGLTLQCQARRAMLSLTQQRPYDFVIAHKGVEYALSGEVRHILYDWKNNEHRVGVQFSQLDSDTEIVLHRLLDPNFTIDVSGNQTVDTAEGKISVKDEL